MALPANSAIADPANLAWLDLHECARRMGLVSNHVVRRFYVQKWAAAGLARIDGSVKPPRWIVSEQADDRLRQPVGKPADAAFDTRALSDAQRAALADRLRIVKAWERARQSSAAAEHVITAEFLGKLWMEGKTISRRTLFNWLAGYQREGMAGLVDARWKTADREPLTTDHFLDEVKRLYLTLRRPKLTVCHEMALLKAAEQGWTVRGYKTCQRMIDAIPRAVILKMRFGEEAHTNDAQPFIEKDYSKLASNEIWCGDHHQFDVMVKTGERLDASSGQAKPIYARPWLSAWMDERSRKIVGWTIIAGDPNSDTILEALSHGIGEHGVPEDVRMDNGKDYDCYAFHGETKKQRRRRIRLGVDERTMGVFVQLGIGTKRVQPYHGQSKPIERFFGTLEDRFGRTWETYFGNKPENRPEDFQAKLDAGRAPTLEDFTAAFELWLQNDYHARGHLGDSMEGRSPSQVWMENLASKRTATPELLDLLLLKPTKPLKVHQNGVSWSGLHYGQFEPALQGMLGQQVVLRVNPRDVSRMSVWTVEGRFVCVASANTKISPNADATILRAAIAAKQKQRQTMKDYAAVRPRLSEDLTDTMIRATAARNKAAGTDLIDPSLPPPSLKPVRSSLEEQLPAIQRAMERRSGRVAVGAESLDLLALASHWPTALAEPAECDREVLNISNYQSPRESLDE